MDDLFCCILFSERLDKGARVLKDVAPFLDLYQEPLGYRSCILTGGSPCFMVDLFSFILFSERLDKDARGKIWKDVAVF